MYYYYILYVERFACLCYGVEINTYHYMIIVMIIQFVYRLNSIFLRDMSFLQLFNEHYCV